MCASWVANVCLYSWNRVSQFTVVEIVMLLVMVDTAFHLSRKVITEEVAFGA